MSDFVDDFLAGLEADKSKPREDFSADHIAKILMSTSDNQGTIVFAPFNDSVSKKPYISLRNVREFKATNSKFKDGEAEVWHRILPKEAYGTLTEVQAKLYDEVVGLFDEFYDNYDADDAWAKVRTKTYSLFQGIVLNQYNTDKEKVTDYVGRASLLIFPSKSPVNALATAIDAKIASMGGNKSWIPAVFSPNADGRDGAMSISFTKKADNGIGYECSVGFEFNSSYARIIPAEGFPKEEVDKLQSMVSDFIGWQNGENGLFDDKVFTELRDHLVVALKTMGGVPETPESTPAANNNGVDPMLSGTQAAQAAPAAESTPATQIPGAPKMPF